MGMTLEIPISTSAFARKRQCSCCKQYRFLRDYQGRDARGVCLTCRRFRADRKALEKKARMLARRVVIARRQRDEAIALEHKTLRDLDAVNRNIEWNRHLHNQQKVLSVRSAQPQRVAA